MSQWGQPQQGFQQPMQTGFPGGNPQFQLNPQFQPQGQQFQQQQQQFQPSGSGFQQGGYGAPGGGLQPQPTGFQMQRPGGMMQSQPTGYPGGQPMLQGQPTGFAGVGNFGQQGMPPPVPPLPTQFQQNQGGGMLGLQQPQQPNRFLSASPGLNVSSLVPQATGFPGRAGPLVAQPTGFIDPRLQMMSQTFMPINTSAPYTPGGLPQLAQHNLQESFQQHNQELRGTATQQLSWALSKAEKKNYDKIFRVWDTSGTGFISGQAALEVFGACGLPQNELAKIWSLADIEDRGKLNIAEFHVAMGLIYRRLNGTPIPDQLPSELVPPSARDLDSSVDFLKNVLQHESRSRSPSTHGSLAKVRTFGQATPSLEGRDATIYKHSDAEPPGGFYKPRSRHVDRDAVRRTNDNSPSSDLSDMKRQLTNTASMLDRAAEDDMTRTKEDEELDQEMSDLKYRVKRVKEDLDYNQRGPRTSAREEERRKLERELLELLHERIPEVERKSKARDERKERERREWARNRDRANDRSGRYDTKEDPYSSSRRYDDYDRPSSRNYDRDSRSSYRRSPSRSRSRERRDRSRDRDRDYGRPRSPPYRSERAEPVSRAPPKPSRTPVPDMKNMTAEERRAHAQRLIQERRVALGLDVPSSSTPAVDTSIEDRLQQEKKEAEVQARASEQEREERERARRDRLEREKEQRGIPSPSVTVTAPAPAPTAPSASVPAPKAPAPPPPKSRGPPPRPPPGRAVAPKPPVAAPPPPKAAPPPPREPEVDPEEEAFRAREATLKKQREDRAARLRKLEEEEAEAERLEEERIKARIAALKAKSQEKAPSPPPAARVAPAPVSPPFRPPPPESAPPAASATSAPVSAVSSTNPFSRMMQGQTSPAVAATPSTPPVATANNGPTNPWAGRPQTAPPQSIPKPPRSPAPAAIKSPYNIAPASDDDWDEIQEHDGSDSSSDEDEIATSRAARANIAQQLFGGMMPRPASAAPANTGRSSTPASPGPTSAPPTSAPGLPAPPPAPAPPAAPAAPPPPALQAPVPAAAAGGRGALLSSIQGGLKLRPTKTVDKSGPALSGKVIGDAAPPAHVNSAPRPASPPPPAPVYSSSSPVAESPSEEFSAKSNNRQSVDWMSNRAAADAGITSAAPRLPSTIEADEDDFEHVFIAPPIPAIQVEAPSSEPDPAADLMSDIDKSIQHKVRSLYAYEGDGADDLSFPENAILNANPSKTGGDWWFGVIARTGQSGLFPKTYVDIVKPVKAKALYDYAAENADELSLQEGQIVSVVDNSEEEWWKAEKDGLVLVVPAAYLELVEGYEELSVPMATEESDLSSSPGRPQLSLNEQSFTFSENPGKQEAKTSDPRDQSAEGPSTDVDEDSDASSDSEYLSFGESDDEDVGGQEQTEDDRMARERERQMVLEAAGLIVKTVEGVAPPPVKLVRRSTKSHRRPRLPPPSSYPAQVLEQHEKRRPPPEAPKRRKPKRMYSKDKELPPIPPEPEDEPQSAKQLDPIAQLDDAYARYESFKNQQLEVNTNRLSVMSTDSGSITSHSSTLGSLAFGSSPTATSPLSTSPAPSQSHLSTFSSSSRETRDSRESGGEQPQRYQFLNFLSKSKTPEPAAVSAEGRKFMISGPMALGSVLPGSASGVASPSRASLVSPGSPGSAKLQPLALETPMSASSTTTVMPPSMASQPTTAGGQEAVSREASPAFGTSWASLVDKTALEGIPSSERKRQEAIFELINTEVAYVRDLQLIVEVFYSSMLDILSHKEITVVFANVEDILLTNTAFLSSLEERQKECRLYVDSIGDILLNHIPNMGVYLEYCVNQQTANKVLQSLKQSKPTLVEHMNRLKANPATRNLDLGSYLLEPMQRVTRYPLLIQQIAHYTSQSESTDHSEQEAIEQAKDLSKKLLDNINETIREQEGRETLQKLSEGGLWIGQGRLDLTAPTRYMGDRRLLKQGVLSKAKSGRKLKAFLCSDILVLTDHNGKTLYRMPIPLAHAQVKETVGTSRDESTFQVLQAYPRGGDSIGLKSNSQKECKDWVRAIESASRKCRHAEERAVRKGYHSNSIRR
ncbi:hypothetical protein FA15DRAFT_600278 [Coprinopsis marcescibilis]|uniref:Actin cytoskeleton-regulatory complex protein PAN1 n=1 Tax=Coprinopsis marcescibilis TaxID=230819 RepID=A0A5C3KW33_COPMA|nr:hypothetical protein FA15DRAFT_600278 [Coprinopsis marcescibilis]